MMKAAVLVLCVTLAALFDRGTSTSFRSPFVSKRVEPPKTYKGEPVPEDEWIEQRLDHFNVADTRTWKQRYFVNDAFYREGGPVFIMIGGEGEQSPIWMVDGSWIEDAKKFGAMLLSLEHRYYGKSHPTRDLSVRNLAYLSSEQALEDLAYFVHQMKIEMNLYDNKWVAFGGSYPGNLAAWFRMKYPHLVAGAVATSAPLYAVLDFQEYLAVTAQSLATTGPDCNANIHDAIVQLEEMVDSWSGRREVVEKFKLCDNLRGWSKLDNEMFFQAIAESFNGVVQYNKDNRDFYGAKATDITIDVVCDIMNLQDKEPVDRLATVMSTLMTAYDQECFEFSYSSFMKNYGETSWRKTNGGGRQWFYQTCTEFGYFQTSEDPNQPFGNHYPLDLMLQQCKDLFGRKFSREFIEAGIARTNTKYGGLDIQVTNIVLPNGSIDQWHYLSPLTDLNESAKAIYINGTAHCANMYPLADTDPPQLVEARKQITEAIASWIGAEI